MYVAVRDMILNHAGYSCVAEGLQDLDLTAVELAVSPELRILAPDTPFMDLRPIMASPEAHAALRESYHRAGFHVCGLMLATNFNAEDIAAETRWVVRAVRIAETLGAPVVRLDAAMTGQQELPLPRRVQMYAAALREVLAATPESRVALAIENHGFQGNDPEWLEGVLQAAASPRIGVTLDPANFYWAGLPLEDVYSAVEWFAPYVRHVHCKNLRVPEDLRNERRHMGWGYGEAVCPVPDGDVNHRRVATILRNAGFRGGLTIEDESLSKFDKSERRRQLRRDADHLAEVAVAVGGDRHPQEPATA